MKCALLNTYAEFTDNIPLSVHYSELPTGLKKNVLSFYYRFKWIIYLYGMKGFSCPFLHIKTLLRGKDIFL